MNLGYNVVYEREALGTSTQWCTREGQWAWSVLVPAIGGALSGENLKTMVVLTQSPLLHIIIML